MRELINIADNCFFIVLILLVYEKSRKGFFDIHNIVLS